MRVGFQGELGAFSEEAARTLFGDVECVGFPTFDALMAAVDAREVEAGLQPCENAIFGPIARAYDLLAEYRAVKIVDEIIHPVKQMLVGVAGATLEGVTLVRSHPVALEQCRIFLAAHPAMRTEIVDDTAAAVRRVVEAGDPTVAAIGSALAAERYGGILLAHDVHDDPGNVTRFFAIARDGRARKVPTRACVALRLAHRPGSLRDALDAVARRGLNLGSLVARPLRARPFEYAFYLEFDCPDRATLDYLQADMGGDSDVLGFY